LGYKNVSGKYASEEWLKPIDDSLSFSSAKVCFQKKTQGKQVTWTALLQSIQLTFITCGNKPPPYLATIPHLKIPHPNEPAINHKGCSSSASVNQVELIQMVQKE
jgi:hypothetical protein